MKTTTSLLYTEAALHLNAGSQVKQEREMVHELKITYSYTMNMLSIRNGWFFDVIVFNITIVLV